MEAKEIRDLMGAYASMYSQQEEVIAEAECECEEEESDEKEAPEMMGEKEEVDEATRLAVMARQRAVELGAKRRSTKEYKQGLNRRTGPTERRLYDLSNRQASTDASLETQKMSGDTGAHGQNYADRIDKRNPKNNPKHNANKENINASYEYDLFDVILEYLVAEGYADTNKAALAIMANMSEEWRQSIVEEAPERIELHPANPRLMKNAGPARVHNPNKSKKVKRVD